MWLLRDCTREDRLGLIRTLRASAVIMTVATFVLMIPLLRVVLNSGRHLAELALYVIPQALPLSIPIGLTVGILWGLGRTAASTRSRALIVLIAAIASVASFTVVDWVVPAANQGFRVAMIGHSVPKGANELTLEELRQLLDPTTGEQQPPATTSDVRSLALNYHGRLALAGAPLVLALFALALTGRRQWGRTIPLLAGCLAIFGYYAVMYSARRLGVDRTLSAFAAAWAPNAAFLVVSVAVMFIRSRPANEPARA